MHAVMRSWKHYFLQNGFTPLIQASQDGHLDVVKLLIQHDSERVLEQRTKVIAHKNSE